MLRMITLVVLFSLVALLPVAGQTNDNNEKARQSATKLASSFNDIANVKMVSGDKLTGRISEVTADSFKLSDSGNSRIIRFSDVKEISKHRKGLSTGAWIAIASTAAVTAVLVTLFRIRYCNERSC